MLICGVNILFAAGNVGKLTRNLFRHSAGG